MSEYADYVSKLIAEDTVIQDFIRVLKIVEPSKQDLCIGPNRIAELARDIPAIVDAVKQMAVALKQVNAMRQDLSEALFLTRSMILSGEQMSPEAQAQIDAALRWVDVDA